MQNSNATVYLQGYLQRWTAFSAIALILATYKLWTPQTLFPQVPVFEVLCNAPAWLDWVSLVNLIVGLLVLALSGSANLSRCGCVLVLVPLAMLVCLDQHRFQPWAYELFLFVVIWLCCEARLQFTLMRWLMISIYFYSAIGKFDFEFLHSVGQQMLGAMFKLFGQNAAIAPDWLRLGLVSVFPLTELAIAVGLAWPKSRRVAGLFAIGLHLTLIVILGPMGLNHRLGVLLWNAQFAVQAYLLFVAIPRMHTEEIDTKQTDAPESTAVLPKFAHAGCMFVMALAMGMPLTERLGIWDHWPSWALYAPHSSRVRVEVAGASLSRLPTELVALTTGTIHENDGESNWVIVPIDLWSLKSLDTPIYPQSRFQIGVAKHIAFDVNSEHQVRLTVLGNASRFTGLRRIDVVEGAIEIAKSGGNYWLNTHPRVLIQGTIGL